MNILEIGASASNIQDKIKNSPTGVTFVSLVYTNKAGEKSQYLLNVGASHKKAKETDIETLKKLDVSKLKTKFSKELLTKAVNSLLTSLLKPSKAHSEAQKDAYIHLATGIKEHSEYGDIYLYGLVVNKTIIVKGEYKKVNSRELTICKNWIKKNYMKSSNFRMFIMKNADSIK